MIPVNDQPGSAWGKWLAGLMAGLRPFPGSGYETAMLGLFAGQGW